MSLNELNVDTYVYEGHNNHSTKYISDGNITFEQLKESSIITIPEKLFIVTLSEQNISTSKLLNMLTVGIIGGAGYTAGELIRLLLNHSKTNIDFVYSTSNAGNKIYQIHLSQ